MPRHGEGTAFGLGALSAGALISAAAAAYKVGEAVLHLRKLHDVGEENAVFVRMVERVRLDLMETERLTSIYEVKIALQRSPEKVEWIKQTITRCRIAMEEKAKWTESVRKGVEGGKSLSLRKRIWWVLEEHEKLENRRMELAMCHLGLLQVINFLGPLEPLACCQPEGIYRANERFYREADTMFQRPEVTKLKITAESKQYDQRYGVEEGREQDVEVDRRYRETYQEPRGQRQEDYTEEEVSELESPDMTYADIQKYDRNIREYETSEGDVVLEDSREFEKCDRSPREYERVEATREYREYDSEPQEEGGEREHREHRHRHHESSRGSSHRGGGGEEDEVIIKRRIIKRKVDHSSRL
jgi:hypothetical protein